MDGSPERETGPAGVPPVDELFTTFAAEQRQLNAAFAVDDAERTVATARVNDLAAQHAAAKHCWTAATDQLAAARNDGDAAAIAAARASEGNAFSEINTISDAVIAEQRQIINASKDSNTGLSEGTRRLLDAGSAIAAAEALATQSRDKAQ